MDCKLKIYDPVLSYYLGRDSFESYRDFRNVFENKLAEGTFPLSDKIVPVDKTETGYSIEGSQVSVDAAIQLGLSNLLETNDPNLQFSRLIDTYNLYLDKYTQDYIDNKTKKQDENFLESLMKFYENFPVDEEFKETGIYQGYLSKTEEIKNLLNEIEESLKVSDQLPTNESELWNPREEPYYIYTLTKLYKNSQKPVFDSEDNLSLLRAKVVDHLSTLKDREFFVRLEPDSALNMQTAEPDSTWKWGVVAVLYERVSNEYKRVYVKNEKGEITLDESKAGFFGANQSKNLTFTVPTFTGKEAYSKINLDARQALIQAREDAKKEPSSYYPLQGFNQQYPKSDLPITLTEFIQDSNVKLKIASDKDRIFYSGNLYVEFPNGEKAPTNRLPLNEQWKKLVLNLINTEHSPENVEKIVSFLNTLLSFKGGDISFWNRNGKIIVYRHSKKVGGNFIRVKEETPKQDVPELLEYARINVDKRLLETEDVSEIPYIQNGELKFKNFSKKDWENFYKEHHSTIARQVQIGKEKWFGPIKSLLFNVESPVTQLINEQEVQIQNPRLGDIEIEPDQQIDVLTILDNIESLVNQTSGSTRDILQILGVLSQENRDKFESIKIIFTTKRGKNFKGVSNGDLVEINYNLIPDINHIGDILAHELVHQTTAKWLQNNPLDPLTQRLEGLLDFVPENIPQYNRSNIYELLASLSNPEIAEQLKLVKIKDKSLLEEITDLIKEVLTKVFGLENLQRNDPNLYDELVNKLIAISTKDIVRQVPEVLKDQPKNKYGLKKRDVGNLFLGYDQASLDAFQEKMNQEKDDKTFLDSVVESIDAKLAQYIDNKGLLSDFIAGRMSFEATFTELYNQFYDEVEQIEKEGTTVSPQQDKFFQSLEDFDFLRDYWIEKTGFAKIRKGKIEPLEEELSPEQTAEDTRTEEDTETNEDKETKQMVEDGANEEKLGKERGTETSSLNAADPISRTFVKMLPAIERDKKTLIYTRTETQTENGIEYKFFLDGKEVLSKPENFISTPFGFIKIKENQLGQPQLTDYSDTWKRIATHLVDLLSLEEMFEKIDSTPELIDLVPEIFVFKNRLDKPITNSFQAEVRSKIETSFKRAKVDVYIVLKKDGNFAVINESNDFLPVARKQVNTKFLSNLKTLDKYYDRDKGEFKIQEFLKTFGFERNGELQTNLIEKNMDILPMLGFEFDPKTIKSEYTTEEYRDFKVNLIKFLNKFKTIPINIADFIVRDQVIPETNEKIDGLNNFFKRVYELENKHNPLTVSLMVTNAEGENQSSHSVFNSLLQTKIHYNRSQTEEELNRLVPRTKNPLFKYSLTRNLLFKNGERTGRFIQIENLNGLKIEQKGSASRGSLLIDLEDSDWILTNFVTMLKKGLIENTRAETASTTYAFKMNDWNLNFGENKKTPFSINEIQGIFKNNKIVFETQDSPIYQQWVNYLKGEIERARLNNKPFGLFSDVFTKEQQTTLLETGIEPNVPMIQKALGDWFTNQYEEYSEMFENAGGYESINSSVQINQEGKYDREIKKLVKNKKEEYKAFYAINLLILHTEEIILFQGDISESPKYFKRAKGVQSTGTPLSKSEELTKFLQEELTKSSFGQLMGTPLRVGDNFDSATIKDDIKTSAYYESGQFQSGYTESKKAFNESVGINQTEEELKKEAESVLAPVDSKGKKGGYAITNIGDGDAFINPDFYFYLLNKVGSMNQDQITGYKALVLEFKKNIDKYLSKEQVQELRDLGIDFTLTDKEQETLDKGMSLIEKGKVVLPKLKCLYRGNGLKEEIVQKEVMDKFALTPLFPQFTKGKPVATALLFQMLKNNIGYTKFESGTKIGSFGEVDFIKEIESGNLEVTLDGSQHQLQEEFLREQIKTPEKVKKENTFGSQFRKLVISGLSTPELKELASKWESLNQEFSELTEQEVLERFGITKVNGQWDYSNIDYVKVADILLEESERRDLPDNLKVYFDKYKQGKLKKDSDYYKYFEASFGNQQIQSLLASIIKKIAVQKLSGAQLIGISPSVFDRNTNKKGKTRELGFYHFKEGKVQAAECKVSLIGNFKNLFNLPEVNEKITKEMSTLEKTDILNNLLLDDNFIEKYKDHLTIIGYRIPTQGFNSMEVMVIREFLPSFYGPAIVTPPEITVKSGADFDYDKWSVIFPSLDKEGNLNTKGKKGIQNQMIQTSKDILLDKVNYYKLITPNTNELVFDLLDEIFEKLEVSTKDAKGTKVVTPFTNFQKFKAVKGKGLLGIAAVWNPSFTLMQRHQWTLNKDYLKEIRFRNKVQNVKMKVNPVLNHQDEIKIYTSFTKDGIAKQEIISQLINVTVDMPSDDKFGHSIFNKSDMGAFIYTTSVLGYSLRDSLYFFHQPIIYQYKNLYNSLVRLGYKSYQAKITAAYTLMNIEMPTRKKGGTDFTKAEMNLYSSIFPKNEKELDPTKIYSLTPVNKIPFNKTNRQQIAVLSHYLLLLDQAEQIRTVQSTTNFDTSPDNSLQKVFKRQENYEKAINSNIISKEFIDQIYKNSVISGLNISNILRNITIELFPLLYSKENQNLFREVSLSYRDTEKAFRLLSNDFLLSVIQNFGTHKDKSVYDIASQYLQGNKKLELVNQAEQIQEKLNKEGLNYRLLDILVINISDRRRDKVFNQQLFLGFENSPADKDRLTREFRELLKRPDTKEFAENLAITGMIQSGYSKSPVYFSDVIPEEFITPILTQAFDKYESLSDKEKAKFRGIFQNIFQEYRANELGVKDVPFLNIYYPRESYRLVPYKVDSSIIQESEKTQVAEDLGLDKSQTQEVPQTKSGKKVVAPQGSNADNLVIFENDDTVFLMNDEQQTAYNGIKAFVLDKLTRQTKEGGTKSFEEPLAKEYSGIIPMDMWNNMIGLVGKGGVGKTTLLKKIIQDIETEYSKTNKYLNLSVIYAAPTHNAVTILQESLGENSESVGGRTKTTASLVLRNQTKGSDDAEEGKPQDELLLLKSSIYKDKLEKGFLSPISSNQIIVVDESSMIDKQFIEDLLFRFKDENTGQMPIFIYMGDYRQLPPISSDESKGFKEGIISATLFSDTNKDKHFVLSKVMRSKDELFHRIFDSVGDQITQQRIDFNQGKEIKPFDFKIYDNASKQSSQNLLIVNENQVNKMIEDYAEVLATNDNPYEMFWVHYNRLAHPNTQELFKKIRSAYFKRLGKPEPQTLDILPGDYIQFKGSLPLNTISDIEFGISSGTVKPTARLKVLETGKKSTKLYDFYPGFRSYFGDIDINLEYFIVYNRQNNKRFVSSFEKDVVKIGKYDKETKRIEVSIKDSTGQIHNSNIPYREFKEIEPLLKNMSRSLDTMFQLSYIGSTHTVQGASIKNVIVGDYNVRKNAPNISVRDMESSLYTALTRTSGKLIIIKPNTIGITNNQQEFVLQDKEVDDTLGLPSGQIQDIYSHLGTNTESGNVVIKPVYQKEGVEYAKSIGGIFSLRVKDSNKHFGNPFSSDSTLVKKDNLIQTNSIEESVRNYIDWITTDKFNVEPERRKWIKEQLQSGNLKGKPIVYYKELNEPSHANALDYLINNWTQEQGIQEPVKTGQQSLFGYDEQSKICINF